MWNKVQISVITCNAAAVLYRGAGPIEKTYVLLDTKACKNIFAKLGKEILMGRHVFNKSKAA